MLMAKSRESAKTKTEGAPGHSLPKVETVERSQANPLWHQLATRVQTKLTVGAPDDPYEREADAMADRVMRMPDTPVVQRKCADCEEEDKQLQRKPLAAQITPFIQTNVQRYARQAVPGTHTAPASVDHVLSGSGRPLGTALQQDMSQRFGHDFSRVRVHSSGAAEQSARDVNAHAYTVGHNIVFGAGQFAPETHGGRRLLAHELTHVVQQSGADGLRADESNKKRGLPPISFGLLQRQESAAPASPAAERAGGGDAVQPEIESLLKTFASASGYEAQNAAAMQAVRSIIRAYNMSTKGLRTMRFKPDLNDLRPNAAATTTPFADNERESIVDFGPSSFSKGFAYLVHVVAHELEHVSQSLIGRNRVGLPEREFLAYTSSVLQVQRVAAPEGKGFLGAQMMGADQIASALPPLQPDDLGNMAEMALVKFSEMPSAEQKKPQYRQELAAAGNKLLDRLKNEAPPLLRPPTKYTPEWLRWYEGKAPTLDILTPEYQDWQDSLKSPWSRVKAVWKRFDSAFIVH
jgi:hypothetical protein